MSQLEDLLPNDQKLHTRTQTAYLRVLKGITRFLSQVWSWACAVSYLRLAFPPFVSARTCVSKPQSYTFQMLLHWSPFTRKVFHLPPYPFVSVVDFMMGRYGNSVLKVKTAQLKNSFMKQISTGAARNVTRSRIVMPSFLHQHHPVHHVYELLLSRVGVAFVCCLAIIREHLEENERLLSSRLWP